MTVLRTPVEERFWNQVARGAPDECWPWQGALRKGYGTFKLLDGQLEAVGRKDVYAHRAAFRLVHGHWPTPQALHGCDNPVCCNAENPGHIHEGTPLDNMLEKVARGRAVNPPGVLNHNSRLTQGEVDEIRQLHNRGGVTQVEIARAFGISQIAVSRIVRRTRYR